MKWLIIVIAVILLAGGGYFLLNNSDGESSSNSEVSQQDTTELASINKLLEKGGNAKCTYDYSDDSGARNEGTAYFSDGKMFGDFTATQPDGTVYQSNVLNLGDTQYVWEKTKLEGYKIDLTIITGDVTAEQTEAVEDSQGFNQDEEFQFDCSDWSVDQSMFDVPTDVNFIDNSEILKNVKEQTQNLSTVCESIEDPALRSACEQSAAQ